MMGLSNGVSVLDGGGMNSGGLMIGSLGSSTGERDDGGGGGGGGGGGEVGGGSEGRNSETGSSFSSSVVISVSLSSTFSTTSSSPSLFGDGDVNLKRGGMNSGLPVGLVRVLNGWRGGGLVRNGLGWSATSGWSGSSFSGPR